MSGIRTLDHFDHLVIGTAIARAIQQMNAMHVRAELRLPPPVSGGQKQDDLVAFAGYCAARIARDLTGIEGWDLFLVGGIDGHADAVVRVHVRGEVVEARATECDPAHAIWNAMCRIEQPLRDAAALLRAA